MQEPCDTSAARTLILGGVRSGKSRLAERLALASGLPVTYLATARPGGDEEMLTRIAAHRARRPAGWSLIEEPLALAETLKRHCSADRCLLVECLTLWLANLVWDPDPQRAAAELAALDACLPQLPGTIVMVSNETNLGVVPADAVSRRYCDLAGELHQRLAAVCDRVILTVAGLPTVLKGPPV